MSDGHFLSHHASATPKAPACIDATTGNIWSYAELEAASNRFAHLLYNLDLRPGDGVVFFCENRPEFYAMVWGAHRAGLYYTPIGWHSTTDEAIYILQDAEARVFVASDRFRDVAETAQRAVGGGLTGFSIGGPIGGFGALDDALASQPATALENEVAGREMLYTSGTTGRPKGVKFPLSGLPIDTSPPDDLFLHSDGYEPGAVVLAPGPLYHASPLLSTRAMHRFGGAVLVVDRFDAEETLALIERHGVTHLICVPTHFIRMLKLEPAVRERYDVSSLQRIQHTGAPCPMDVKYAMIDWFGPIIIEYYGATERVGGAMITSEEWLAHPGSIGRPLGPEAHVLDESNWEELPAGETGVIYFDAGESFDYHGDAEKTRSMYSPQGWITLGDIGHVDSDGYIYLTDRKSNMIITGGVNVYPQEAENRLITHPDVADVAVFGIPNADFGQEVKAVVQVAEGVIADGELEQRLIAYCKQQLATVKCPRSIDFQATLPRQDNGKLYKKELIAKYQ